MSDENQWAKKHAFIKNPLSQEVKRKCFKSRNIKTAIEIEHEAEAIADTAVAGFEKKYGFNDIPGSDAISRSDAQNLAGLYVDYRFSLDKDISPLIGCIEGLENRGLLATAKKLCAGVDAEIGRITGKSPA